MPVISVIIPTYNCGRFIAEAIDSVLAQTRVPDQIIVVDDGSTDNTGQLVRRYPQVTYIKQRNAGVSAARNTGLDAARGEFVTFLDADDRWRPQFVERMHGYLSADPHAAFVFCNFERFEDASGQIIGDQFSCYPELPRPDPGRCLRISWERAFGALVSCEEIPAYNQAMMTRRDTLAGIRCNTRLRLCQDLHFVLQIAMRGAVLYTDEVLTEVRRHDNNASRDVGEMSVHKLRALQALEPYVTGANLRPYHDRVVKAHVDAAIYRIRSGLQHYRDGLKIPGSKRRKMKALVRMALAAVL